MVKKKYTMINYNKQLSPDHYDQYNQQFMSPIGTDPEDVRTGYYEVLTDEQKVKTRTKVWDSDYVRQKYLTSLDGIIGRLDGSIGERDVLDPDDPERSKEAPDTVIWLDKSARPVSWMNDALWDQIAEEGAVKPSDEFLNIDRRNWLSKMGYSHDDARDSIRKKIDIDKIPQTEIARIRAIFTVGALDRDNWEADVWNKATRLDGKNVLICDETKNSGATLQIAVELLKRAIPEATFSGAYFWEDVNHVVVGNHRVQGTVPIWYPGEMPDGRQKTEYGRGVGDVSQAYHEQLPDTDENFKRKLGWAVLSTPHHDKRTYELKPDPDADRLRQDIAFMSYDLADGKLAYRPSIARSDDDYDDKLERYAKQHDIPVDDYAAYLKRRNEDMGARVKKLT